MTMKDNEIRIIVRYDPNESQSFFDPVQAPTAEECKALSDQLRGNYSDFVCMLDLMDIHNMACILEHPTKTWNFITPENIQEKIKAKENDDSAQS